MVKFMGLIMLEQLTIGLCMLFLFAIYICECNDLLYDEACYRGEVKKTYFEQMTQLSTIETETKRRLVIIYFRHCFSIQELGLSVYFWFWVGINA